MGSFMNCTTCRPPHSDLGGYRQKNRRGAAAVEFAMVAPIFILLVFGMIEYGRMVMVQQILTNASREAARIGVLDGSTTAQVTTAATNYLTGASVSGATVAVTPSPPSSATYGNPVTVTITIPFSNVSWLPSPMYLGGQTLKSVSIMRRESPQ